MKESRDRVPWRVVQCAYLIGLILLLTGCKTAQDYSLTYKLWSDQAARTFHEPNTDPHLVLYADERRSDILVQYDEVTQTDGEVRRRAFYLNSNLSRLQSGKKPHFARADAANGLARVPVIRLDSGELIPGTGLCVTISEAQRTCTLYLDGRDLETWTLPAYGVGGGLMRKSLLTPLAVTGDTLRVGAVVGIVGAFAWLESGAPLPNCD